MSVIRILPKTGRHTSIQPGPHFEDVSALQSPGLTLSDKFPAETHSVPARTQIVREGDDAKALIVVRSGWAMQYRILEDGRRQIFQFGLPGDMLGYRNGADRPATFAIEAVTPCEYVAIPLEIVSRIMRQGGRDALRLFEGLGGSLESAFDALTDASRRTALEAVANFIWRMSRRLPQSDKMEFPVNQEQIGDHLGLTAIHVCRTLCKLRSMGVLSLSRGQLSVADPDALAEIGGVEDNSPDRWSEAI